MQELIKKKSTLSQETPFPVLAQCRRPKRQEFCHWTELEIPIWIQLSCSSALTRGFFLHHFCITDFKKKLENNLCMKSLERHICRTYLTCICSANKKPCFTHTPGISPQCMQFNTQLFPELRVFPIKIQLHHHKHFRAIMQNASQYQSPHSISYPCSTINWSPDVCWHKSVFSSVHAVWYGTLYTLITYLTKINVDMHAEIKFPQRHSLTLWMGGWRDQGTDEHRQGMASLRSTNTRTHASSIHRPTNKTL